MIMMMMMMMIIIIIITQYNRKITVLEEAARLDEKLCQLSGHLQ
jgi:hypothetical protein